MQPAKSLKLGILVLLLVAFTIFAGCGGWNPVTPPIDDELDYDEVDRFDSITDSDGLSTFNLEEDVKVEVKVEDEKTGTPLSDIKVDMFLYEDKIVYLVVDPSGDYVPKIIVEEQSYKDYLPQSKIPIISTIVKLIKRTEWAIEGYTSGGAQFSDHIDNKFLKYLFEYIFQYGGKTTLGDIKYSMEDALIAVGDVVLSTGITVVFGLSGPIGWALIAIDVFDMGDTFAVAQWAKKYESLCYADNDQFEVYYWIPIPAPYISSIKIPYYPFIVPVGEPGECIDEDYEEAEILEVLDNFGNAIASQNWAKAKSYCVVGSEEYELVNELEDLIDELSTLCNDINMNFSGGGVAEVIISGKFATVSGYYTCTVSCIPPGGEEISVTVSGDGTTYLEKIGDSWKIYKEIAGDYTVEENY